MSARTIVVLFVTVALLSACSAPDMPSMPQASAPVEESSEHTNQPHLYVGENGPAHWEGECQTGAAQSPIDLTNTQAEDVVNIGFNYGASPVGIINNGHTVQVQFPDGYEGFIEVPMQEGGSQRYNVLQFHYHAPSEHTIGGKAFAAELHIVHYRADDPAKNPAAVIGILLEEGAENAAYMPFTANSPSAEGGQVSGLELDLAALLPSQQTTLRYTGSLTTPPCTEGIAWMVLDTPVALSADQLGTLTAIWENNNRPVQSVNERVLIEDTTP